MVSLRRRPQRKGQLPHQREHRKPVPGRRQRRAGVPPPSCGADEHIDLDEGDDALLVLRRPSDVGGIAIERISQAEHLLLATLAAGRTLDEAANRCAAMSPEFDLAAALRRHVAGNTIVAFRAPVVPTSESGT